MEIIEKLLSYESNIDKESGRDIYASCLAFVLNFSEQELEKAENWWYFHPLIRWGDLSFSELNTIMHWIHSRFPQARREAVKLTSELLTLARGKGFVCSFTIYDLNIFLGKFPDTLKDEIEAIFDEFPYNSDIQVRYSSTWMYSHIDQGEDYSYKKNEHPIILVNGVDKRVVKNFCDKVKNFLAKEKKFTKIKIDKDI